MNGPDKQNDWWDDLSEEDQNLVFESEIQYKKGEFISHDTLVQLFEEWKKNSMD